MAFELSRRAGPPRQAGTTRQSCGEGVAEAEEAGSRGRRGGGDRLLVLLPAAGRRVAAPPTGAVEDLGRQRAAAGLRVAEPRRAVARVNAVAVSGSTAYVGGDFRYVGPETGGFVALDSSSGAAVGDWPVVTGFVAASVAGRRGRLVHRRRLHLGRRAAADEPRARSRRRLRRHAVHPSVNGAVNALALSGSTLYVGGAFSTANGSPRNAAAAFDATTGALLAWDPAFDAAVVYALAVSGSTVYAGGIVHARSTAARPGTTLAAVDATTGAATAWNPNVDRTGLGARGLRVDRLRRRDLRHVNGSTPRSGCGRFRPTTGVATAWNPNLERARPPRRSRSTAARSTSAATSRRSTAARARNGVACVDAGDGCRHELEPERRPATNVYAIAVDRSNVIAGGRFDNVDGATPATTSRSSTRRSGAATAFAPVVGGDVWTLAASGAAVFAGGDFQSVGGVRRPFARRAST